MIVAFSAKQLTAMSEWANGCTLQIEATHDPNHCSTVLVERKNDWPQAPSKAIFNTDGKRLKP